MTIAILVIVSILLLVVAYLAIIISEQSALLADLANGMGELHNNQSIERKTIYETIDKKGEEIMKFIDKNNERIHDHIDKYHRLFAKTLSDILQVSIDNNNDLRYVCAYVFNLESEVVNKDNNEEDNNKQPAVENLYAQAKFSFFKKLTDEQKNYIKKIIDDDMQLLTAKINEYMAKQQTPAAKLEKKNNNKNINKNINKNSNKNRELIDYNKSNNNTRKK